MHALATQGAGYGICGLDDRDAGRDAKDLG